MENVNNLVCIYSDDNTDIKNIMLKIYSEFTENELKEEFKT